jgi:pyruvate,water dikinase
MMAEQWLFWLEELCSEDNDVVGKKCANLGELTRTGLPVPPGFALSVDAYHKFLNETDAAREIRKFFDRDGWRDRRLSEWAEVSSTLRGIVETQQMPSEMAQAITSKYQELQIKCGMPDPPVSVRSAGAVSRPGQYETHLNIRGSNSLLTNIIRVWSSSFNPRSLAFRAQNDLPIESDPIGVAVLGMIDARTAGVTLTADPNTGDDTKIIIEANWGLGESVVSGTVTPDYFIVDKGTLCILEKRLGDKRRCISCTESGILEKDVLADKYSEFCLSDDELREIGKYGKRIEKHFKGVPQDIEWAISGEFPKASDIFFLQTRPAIIAQKKSATDTILDLIISQRH